MTLSHDNQNMIHAVVLAETVLEDLPYFSPTTWLVETDLLLATPHYASTYHTALSKGDAELKLKVLPGRLQKRCADGLFWSQLVGCDNLGAGIAGLRVTKALNYWLDAAPGTSVGRLGHPLF
jgi:hypothetical protein